MSCVQLKILKMLAVTLAVLSFSVSEINAAIVFGEKYGHQVKGATTQPKLAFVISVSDYDGDKIVSTDYQVRSLRSAHVLDDLANPNRDAQLIAQRLRAIGFFVYVSQDSDKARLEKELRWFRQLVALAGEHAISVTYFAGHGIQSNGRNYVLPAKAVLPFAELPRDQGDLDQKIAEAAIPIENLMFASPNVAPDAGHLIILDACRNNPWEGVISSAGFMLSRGLVDQLVSAPRTLLVFSTMPGAFALDGDGDNSPFALAVNQSLSITDFSVDMKKFELKGIEPSDLHTIASLRAAMRDVASTTGGQQVPYMNGPSIDDVCLGFCQVLTLSQAVAVLENGGNLANAKKSQIEALKINRQTKFLFALDREKYTDSQGNLIAADANAALDPRNLSVNDDQILFARLPLPAWTNGFSSQLLLPPTTADP
jgi:hypothetical protein